MSSEPPYRCTDQRPLQLTPEHTGRERPLHVFVPIAPAPQRVEVEYADASGMHVLVVDTRDVRRLGRNQ